MTILDYKVFRSGFLVCWTDSISTNSPQATSESSRLSRAVLSYLIDNICFRLIYIGVALRQSSIARFV